MAIYKSSYNKKPEKEEKPKKERPIKEKKEKVKSTSSFKIKPSVICLVVFLGLFVACCLPSNFLKNFLLGVFGLSVYPVTLIGTFFSIMFLRKAKYNVRRKYVVYITVALCIVWFIFHLIFHLKISLKNIWIFNRITHIFPQT